MHKHVHSKTTYALRVHQFTTQKVGKGGKRNEFSLNTKSMFTMHKHVHSKATHRLRVHQFTTQHVGKGTDFTQHKMSMHKHVHSKVTYSLRVRPFTTQQVGKGGKRNEFNSTQNEYTQTCSFKGNLPAKSVPVHNTASG